MRGPAASDVHSRILTGSQWSAASFAECGSRVSNRKQVLAGEGGTQQTQDKLSNKAARREEAQQPSRPARSTRNGWSDNTQLPQRQERGLYLEAFGA
jgi:hypothetical protein